MGDTSRTAGALILSDLALFNQAVVLFEKEVQPEILKQLNEKVLEWATQNNWVANYSWTGDMTEIWIAPESWNAADNGEEIDLIARFWLDYLNDETSSYQLADLCGVGEVEVGFWLNVSYDKFGGKTRWNNATRNIPEHIGTELQKLGFYDEGKGLYFIPLRLDAARIASAWENEDYEEVLVPVTAVLDRLKEAKDSFDAILSLARP